MDKRVRVDVRSADYLSVAGLTSCLENTPEITLLTGDQRAFADVVVVAAKAPGAAATELARAGAPVPVVLVLNELGEADLVEAGRVAAVLPRAAATGDRLVRTVLAAARKPAASMPLGHVREADGQLTCREIDILRLMADGMDTAEIASTLSYSERTIKSVFYGLTARLNLRNRPHAVAYALRKGLI